MLNLTAQLVCPDNFRKIHNSALKVLATVGAKVEHQRSRKALQQLGCIVKGDIVLFPIPVVESFVEDMRQLGKAKADALDPKRPRLVPHATGQATQALDIQSDSLRPATRKDLVDATRLANALPGVVLGHPSYIPQDVHPMLRDLHTLALVAQHFPSSREVEIFSADTIDFFLAIGTAIRNGRREMLDDPPFSYRAYGASPFVFGAEGLEILWKLVDTGLKQGIYVGHVMPVLGVSTPITLAGYLVSLAAEGLQAAILHKAITGKTRFFLGGPCSIDMSTFASTQSSPESALLHLASMELSRYYGDPEPFYPYALSTDSKLPDIQAGIEKTIKAMLAVAAGSREIVTGLGVLAQAGAVSLPQFLIDYELCMMLDHLLKGIDFADDNLCEDLIINQGIRADFLSHTHTVEHFRDELFLPQVFDRRTLAAWDVDRRAACENAKEKVAEILKAPPVEFLDSDQLKEINKIIKHAELQLADR